MGSPQPQQQLPGCARAVPSPTRQPGSVTASPVARVYGAPLTYAGAVVHGVAVSNGDSAAGTPAPSPGAKSPGKAGSAGGRVRFADDV